MDVGAKVKVNMVVGFSLALAAGAFAAIASVFSKLAFEEGGVTLKQFICLLVAEEQCTIVCVATFGKLVP